MIPLPETEYNSEDSDRKLAVIVVVVSFFIGLLFGIVITWAVYTFCR